VYAVWDRLVSPPSGTPQRAGVRELPAFTGDVWFSRTTNGGTAWEPARKIFKAGTIAQTIGNVIAVLPDNATFHGALVDVFTLLRGRRNDNGTRGTNIAVIRSTDHGATWTKQETIVSDFRRGIVVDPDDGAAHRTGDINPRWPSTGERRDLRRVAGQPVRATVQHRVVAVAGRRCHLVVADPGQPDPAAGSG
jgi:hypothetical protein